MHAVAPVRPHTPHYTPLARPHATHARPHILTGPRTSATYPSLQLSRRRFWKSEHVIATPLGWLSTGVECRAAEAELVLVSLA